MSDIPMAYPIILRVVRGYVEASQPDLGIYRVRGRFDDIRRREEIGAIVLDLWQEIGRMIATGTAEKAPSAPKNLSQGGRPEAMSTGEVAELLGVSTETVRRMCKAGKLDHYTTPGGHQKIRVTDPTLGRFLPRH